MEGLCFDFMEMIGKEYTNIKETKKNKKIYSDIVKHLEYYFEDEYFDYHDEPITPEYIKMGNMRTDTGFLEYEDLWSTNHYKIICDKWGGEEKYDEWCDNYF